MSIYVQINAKLEDVGLNEELKSTETRNGHKINQKSKSYILFFLHRIKDQAISHI